jgi:predicted chitinase
MKHILYFALMSVFAVKAAEVTVTAPAAVVTVTAGQVAAAVSSVAASASGSTAPAPGSVIYSSGSAGTSAGTPAGSGTIGSGFSSSTSLIANPLVTEDEFMSAWKAGAQIVDPNTPAPTHAQFVAMVNNASPAGGITNRQELAMFFAQIMHESGALFYKKEISPPPGAYGTGAPGKQYYGRGYIQLSWPDNYKKASEALFGTGSTELYDNPDQVATNEDLAWGVSFFYWKVFVKPAMVSNPVAFGLSTKAINGPLECQGQNTDKAQKRFKIYTAILKIWEPSMTPVATGCYN